MILKTRQGLVISRVTKSTLILPGVCIALCAHAEGKPKPLLQCIRSFANIVLLRQKDTRVPDPLLAENLEKLPYVKEALQSLSSSKEFRDYTLINPSQQVVLRGKEFENFFTSSELSAIDHYTRGGYKSMNGALRNGAHCDGECQLFSDAIRKLPSYEGIVFRRIVFKDGEIPSEYLSPTSVLMEKGFTSAFRKTDALAAASAEKERAAAAAARRMGIVAAFAPRVDTLANSGPAAGEVLMVLRSQSAKAIEGGSSLGRLESEVVFDAGTYFKKVGVHRSSRGGYILFLDEVRP